MSNMTSHDDAIAEGTSFSTKTLMPLMNTPFVPGTHLQAIEAMAPGAQRDIAQAEYYYFSGQPDQALATAAPYLMWLMWLIWQHFFRQNYERIRPASLNPTGVM